MIYTILEVPVVWYFIMTKSPNAKRLIKRMNKIRKNILDEYGREEWVWESYDGEKDKYVFLELHRMKNNTILILLLILMCYFIIRP